MAGALKFVALNGFTAVAALALASRCQLSSRAERLLAAAVLFVGVALASGLSLGLAGQLRFWPLLAVQGAIAAIAAPLARWPLVLDLVHPRETWRTLLGATERTAAVLIGLAYVYVLFLGIVSEPFTGDALMYHLPIAVEYLRQGRIVVPELGRYWNNELWAYYPGNAYVLDQWWLLPFGTGVLVDLVQWPAAFGAALAAHVLARRFGASGRAAVWSGLLFLAVPIVINQSKTALVDVTITFLFAAGLAFLLATPVNVSRLILAGIAWGAGPGVKLAALPVLAIGAACVTADVLNRNEWRRAFRQLILMGIACGLGAALFSGYWPIRNYRLTGSAIFPLNLVAGDELAWSNIIYYGPLMPLLDLTVYEPMFLYNYETGAGVQFVGLALPASLALAVASLRRRQFGRAMIALLPLIVYAFWLFRSSRSLHTLFRYVLPAMPVGFAAVAWMMDRTSKRDLVRVLAVGCVAFSMINALPHVGTFLLPSSARAALVSLRRQSDELGRFGRMGDLALQDYRRAWHYLDQLPGSRHIAARHLIFAYPMLGEDFRHRLHFFEITTRERWLADLRANDVQFVALSQLLDPNVSLSFEEGYLQLHFRPKVVSDEYVAGTQAIQPQEIQGVRIRYEVPSPESSRVMLAVNGFAHTEDLPLGTPGTAQDYTMEWKGQITSLQLLLGAVPRTGLREELQVNVSSIELIDANGHQVPVSLAESKWGRLGWPVEYYWMASDPEHFHVVLKDRDVHRSPYSGEMWIYEFIDEKPS